MKQVKCLPARLKVVEQVSNEVIFFLLFLDLFVVMSTFHVLV